MLGAALAVGPGAAVAADFQLNPRVDVGGIYNDNIRLDETRSRYVRVSGGFVDAVAEFRSLDALTEISVVPRVRATYFPGDSQENSTDLFFVASASRKFQKGRVGFRAEASQQDTINSEVPLADFNPDASLGEGQGADAGFLDVPNERRLLVARPDFDYRLTPRSSIGAEANLTDVSYDRFIPTRQIGYRDYTLNARYSFSPSARTTWRAVWGFSQFEPDTQFSESQTLRAGIEIAQRVSETQEYYARGGIARTELETRTGSSSSEVTRDNSASAAAGVRWSWVRSRLFIDATYDVAPTSTGLTAQRTEGRLWYAYDLSPTLRVFAAARGVKEEDQGNSPLARERDYITFGGGAEWRFRRDFTLTGRFDAVSSTDRGDAEAAEANSVSVWLRWQPPRRDK